MQHKQNQIDQERKTLEFEKRTLNDRIEVLTETLANERELREMWIGKFEDEQKQLSSSSVQGMELRAKI